MRIFTILNAQMLKSVAVSNPEVRQVPGINSFLSEPPPTGCKCSAANNERYRQYQTRFENTLRGLSSADVQKLIQILKIDRFCYMVDRKLTCVEKERNE